MNDPIESVPRYSLYGEALSAEVAEIVHCETIASRSSLYRWEISAHRHPALSQVLFLASGQVDAMLDGEWSSREGPLLVIAPSGIVHGFRFSEGAMGFVLTLSREFLMLLAPGDPLAGQLGSARIAPLDTATRRRLLVLGRQLVETLPDMGPDTVGPDRLLLQRALAEAWLRIATAPLARPDEGSGGARLRSFQALVERHFREHRALSFYAGELGCTERTLARLTQSAWDMTPTQFIHRRIAMEARRLLRFTNANCTTVAAELGFEDPSYFSRFHLRMTGRRPSAEKH